MENVVMTKSWVYPLEIEDAVTCTFALEWWKCRAHEPFVRDSKQVSYGTPKPVDGYVKLRRTPRPTLGLAGKEYRDWWGMFVLDI